MKRNVFGLLTLGYIISFLFYLTIPFLVNFEINSVDKSSFLHFISYIPHLMYFSLFFLFVIPAKLKNSNLNKYFILSFGFKFLYFISIYVYFSDFKFSFFISILSLIIDFLINVYLYLTISNVDFEKLKKETDFSNFELLKVTNKNLLSIIYSNRVIKYIGLNILLLTYMIVSLESIFLDKNIFLLICSILCLIFYTINYFMIYRKYNLVFKDVIKKSNIVLNCVFLLIMALITIILGLVYQTNTYDLLFIFIIIFSFLPTGVFYLKIYNDFFSIIDFTIKKI